jgi:hypothetical protein
MINFLNIKIITSRKSTIKASSEKAHLPRSTNVHWNKNAENCFKKIKYGEFQLLFESERKSINILNI